ncbi:MAG: DUF11 domain-containing protein [Kiritimatiellae bacterium]|nr:DUF11 domain-containing protein [Kiritimatiellia bacterium]
MNTSRFVKTTAAALAAAWLALCAVAVPRAAASEAAYTYDAAGRLVAADYGGGRVITYRYNTAGNLLERRVCGTNASPQADLLITKSADTPFGQSGEPFNFVLTVTNQGPDAATGVQVADELPLGLAFMNAQLDQGGIATNLNGVSAELGTVPAGNGVELRIEVFPDTTETTVTNTASVTGSATDTNSADNTASAALLIYEANDTDGDGMPNWWETLYWGHHTNGVPTDDSDGDGLVNTQEYIVGSSPLESSPFEIETFTRDGEQLTVTFQSRVSRRYVCEATTNLVEAIWTNVGAEAAGDGGPISITDSNGALHKVYRLGVSVP